MLHVPKMRFALARPGNHAIWPHQRSTHVQALRRISHNVVNLFTPAGGQRSQRSVGAEIQQQTASGPQLLVYPAAAEQFEVRHAASGERMLLVQIIAKSDAPHARSAK